jgi:hypothetical protein
MAIKKSSLSGLSFNRSISYVQPVASAGGGGGAVTVGPTATGGTVTTFTDANNATYKVHTFTSSGSFVVSSLGASNNSIELLVVGAGSGGHTSTTGGAGGQVKYYGAENANLFTRDVAIAGSALATLEAATYTVTIGAGQAAGTIGTAASSSFIGTGISVTSTGGSNPQSGQTYRIYSISGNGFQTGTSGSNGYSHGGSGAAGRGSTYNSDIGGQGGNAQYFMIKGNTVTFVGGGGGIGINDGYGATMERYRATGGQGAGRADETGVANMGGGGGGGWNGSGGKNGGSGIVIVKYRIS